MDRTFRISGADSHRKWHFSKNRAASTLGKMESYFLKQQLTDFVITAGGRVIHTHKLVLSAGSEYFADMFAEESEGTYVVGRELCAVDADAVWAVLNYLYTGKIEIAEDTVEELLDAACRLSVDDVFHACRAFQSPNNPSYSIDVFHFPDYEHPSERIKLYQKFTNLREDDAKDSPGCSLMDEASNPKSGNVLYVFGGGINRVEKYDVESDKWTIGDEFKVRLPRWCGMAEADGKLYIAGGWEKTFNVNAVKCYDIERETSRRLPSMGTPRAECGVAILGGSLYVVGGHNSSGDLYTVERFDLKSETWSYVTPMSKKRRSPGVTVLNGKVYVVGGYNKGNLPTVECYDPDTDQWMPCASMATPRVQPGLGVLNGFLYAVGCSNSYNSNTVERYDPKTDTWTKVASRNHARFGVGVGVLGEKLFAIGGSADRMIQNVVEAYDPVKDKWQEVGRPIVFRLMPFVIAVKE